MQTHFRTHARQGFSEEVSRSHPSFECAEDMLDGLPSYAHGIRHASKPIKLEPLCQELFVKNQRIEFL